MNNLKSIYCMLFCILFATTAVSGSDAESVLLNRLIPQPANAVFNDEKEVILDNSLTVTIELNVVDNEAKNKVKKVFKQYFGKTPQINVAKTNDAPKEKEACRIKAAGRSLTIAAADFQGVRYAFSTLRQLAEANGDTEKLTSYRIPETEIEDAPAMSFRGLHLCWFPETPAVHIEKYLRWAAYYKFNYVVLEFWGVYPFRSHPELSWKEQKVSPKTVRYLVNLSKELGVTLIPQFNVFGHASGSRSVSGKHSALDFSPEYQPLFEPDGWTWNLGNPATRKVLTDVVTELYEAFDRPPYFHVGCDEATQAEGRNSRRSDYKQLLIDHLKYFHDLLTARNCRMMMWHDMLITDGNPLWDGKDYVVNGRVYAEEVLKALPRDIIICDWQYGKPRENEQWPTMRYFKELGFPVLACPWAGYDEITSHGKTVNEAHLYGMLCTTWHSGGDNLQTIMRTGATTTWGAKSAWAAWDDRTAKRHLRQIIWDMKVKKYKETGLYEWQIQVERHPEY